MDPKQSCMTLDTTQDSMGRHIGYSIYDFSSFVQLGIVSCRFDVEFGAAAT
jgi:hypothetical protein